MRQTFRIESLERRSLLSGVLDPTFGVNGILAGDTDEYPAARATFVQADGKILFAGGGASTSGVAQLVRLDADGSPDPTFGNNGVAMLNAGSFAQVTTIVATSDGKLVVAGAAPGTNQIVAERINSDGSVDSTFGASGIATSAALLTNSSVGQAAIALQADGKLIVAGETASGEFEVERFTDAGTPDSTFGAGGTAQFSVASSLAELAGLAVANDGSIYVGGDDNHVISVIRVTPNGQRDASFGGSGTFTLKHADGCQLAAIAVQADGKVVLGGSIGKTVDEDGVLTGKGMVVVRLTASGALDTHFGNRGISVAKFINREAPNPDSASRTGLASSMAIQPNGRIVLAGAANLFEPTFNRGDNDFAAVRFLANGLPDRTFGRGGEQTLGDGNLWPSTDNQVNAVAIASTGSIILAGTTGGDAAIARYDAIGHLDSQFGYEGRFGPFPVVPPSQAACLQSDGKLVLADPTGLYRLLSDGQFDPTFGDRGLLLATQDPVDDTRTNTQLQVLDVASLANGQILEALATQSLPSSVSNGFVLIRYNSDGSIDRTFGVNGREHFERSGTLHNVGLFGIVEQPDGKILLQGGGDRGSFVARLTTRGNPDPSFGSAGFVRLDYRTTPDFTQMLLNPQGTITLFGNGTGSSDAHGYVSTAELSARGKLIGPIESYPVPGFPFLLSAISEPDGSARVIFGTEHQVSVLKFNGSQLDTTFGDGGSVILPTSSDFEVEVTPVSVFGSDGDILVVSSTYTGAKLLAISQDGSIDTSFGVQGILTLPQLSDAIASMLAAADGSVTILESGLIARIR